MESRKLTDSRQSPGALLLSRVRTSGLGQTVAWCRANSGAPEATLCTTVLTQLSQQQNDIGDDFFTALQKADSLRVLSWTAAFESALLKATGLQKEAR